MRISPKRRLFDEQGKGLSIGEHDDEKIRELRIYRVSANFASTADGAASNIDLACSGVALGDTVIGIGIDITPTAGVSIEGSVRATDIVNAVLRNNSGGAVDLAATTVTVYVLTRETSP